MAPELPGEADVHQQSESDAQSIHLSGLARPRRSRRAGGRLGDDGGISSFTAQAVPIPKPGGSTYPHTGNILGAGAALSVEYVITGSGYRVTTQNPAGGIPPISQVNFYLDAGAKINAKPFGSCSATTLKNVGPSGCKSNSVASPVGHVLGEVTFGTERVPEETELRAFFAPCGGLLFYAAGHSPVALEIVDSGHWVNSGKPPYGLELITHVSAVATVPGAPLASVRTINLKSGAAIKKGQEADLLRHRAEEVPEGRLPPEDGNYLRRIVRRRTRIRHPRPDRDRDLQGAMPQEEIGTRALKPF
jgi:hypothetical protein